MALDFIDISSWQRGLNLKTIFEKNPALDGVIVKATGGVTYVEDTCDPWIQQLIAMKKPWGFYHFLDDDEKNSTPEKEAEFFVNACKNYFGYGVAFADYEGKALDLGTSYLKRFLDKVYSLTGIKMVIYTSMGVIHSQNFTDIAAAGYGLWLAQWANNKWTSFQDNPWQEGSVAPFQFYMMQQYSGHGKISGYYGAVDLDKFFGDEAAWLKYAQQKVQPTPAPANTTCEIKLPILKKGDFSGYVRTVQILLNKYNSAALAEDGGFGPATYNAVINYQKDRKLKVTGTITAETWAQLLK